MSTTIDRKLAPAFGMIDKAELIRSSATKLNNGIPVYTLNAGTQELVKIEFIFRAGVWDQDISLQASCTNSMVDEGTQKHKGIELSEMLDYYGSYLELDVNQDWAFVTLYSLNKHLSCVLPVVEELLKTAVFPENELGILLNNKKQSFLVDNEKVAYIARTRFSSLIFGDENPYSYKLTLDDFENLKRKHVVDFYSKHYNSKNCQIVISGKIEESVVKSLNTHFGGNDWQGDNSKPTERTNTIFSDKTKKHFIKKDGSVQNAIRMGRMLFNKMHPDYHAMKVVNTIFGGYFGSRLMANIREDKGYTYGIGSRIISLQNAGYFFIATETGVDVCNNAVNEIYNEINRLRTEPVTNEELALVKNYMLGDFLRSADGPFSLADKFKKIMFYELDYSYYDTFVNTIKTITPERIQQLTNTYLNPDDIYELIVGEKMKS